MSGYTHSLRARCASALTHPVTIAALVLLLLNDALFKSLWPDSWVTGKLSDLAWMVFASPLLAFLLSLFMSRLPFAKQAVVFVSYVGLPALYAAFNTSEPLHNRILWGLSLVSGGTAGSPLDPTDSLVIPLGLGIAVWVWRRRPVGSEKLRVRLALLAAGVATFASVATTYPATHVGIDRVGIASNGVVVASSSNEEVSLQFTSGNGGLNWTSSSLGFKGKWGISTVDTPRGRFKIQDSDILRSTASGEWELAYSAAYLQQEANVWIQEQATAGLGLREIARRPYNIVYDEHSGNVIVAMGLQGVLVGTPNGEWSRVALGYYSPTDFSFAGKTGVLLSNLRLWAIAISLSTAFTATSLVSAQYRRENAGLGVAVSLATMLLFACIPYVLSELGLNEALFSLIWVLMGTTFLLAMYLPYARKGIRTAKHFALAMAFICVISSGSLLATFDASDFLFLTIANLLSIALTILIVLFAIAAVSVVWGHFRSRKSALAAFAGMNGLVILVFLMWVQLGFGLTFAKISAFVLVALVAIVLTVHLKRSQKQTRG